MTDRDKVELGSKFWNQGKWDNFVKPFFPGVGNCEELSMVDMGCNAGLFLQFGEEMGFKQVIGVDSNPEAVMRGEEYRDKNGGKYKFVLSPMEKCIDSLPIVDYTILANAHYYFNIADWLDYLDKLQYKTRYCIIVTTEKRNDQCSIASADPEVIRKKYFANWEEVGFIDALPTDDDPSPRKLYGLCFKSKYIDRVSIDGLDCGNHVQDKFYREIEEGKDFHQTKYYRILKGYRKHWSQEVLDNFVVDKIALFYSVKEKLLVKPIIVGDNNRVLDGNHRFSMMKYLGFKTILVRRI